MANYGTRAGRRICEVTLAASSVDATHLATSIPPNGFTTPINLGLSAAVAANALTIAVKGADGNNASATNPVLIPFRSPTAATGTPVWRSLTAASSLVISSGSTLAAVSNVPFRVWIVMFDDGGTLRLGAMQRVTGGSSPTAAAALADNLLGTSTAEGGAGAADSAGVLYTGTAVTSKAYRILGCMEWASGLAVPGTWDAGPTIIQLFGPGVPRPGEVLQTVYATTSTATSTTSSTFQSTANTINISPTSACNLVDVTASGTAESDVTTQPCLTQLHRGSTAIGSLVHTQSNSAAVVAGATHHALDAPGTTSATTYMVKVKNSNNASTVYYPFTGTIASICVREIMA
jgi:hypothetical protein